MKLKMKKSGRGLVLLIPLLTWMCYFSLLGFVVLDSGLTLPIAVSYAVKLSFFLWLLHWPDRLIQQQQRFSCLPSTSAHPQFC